jgi:NAD-dependent dihydropyrimidine dehydrogenase PreA subunit
MYIDTNDCIKCGACLEICPNHGITQVYNHDTMIYVINDNCKKCKECKDLCPAEAVKEK